MICSPHPVREELGWFLRQSRPARVRTMRQFAEQEIVIPDGPYAGRRFRCDRQPYTGLWFDAVDSGRWNRYVATGPTQSGKTLTCFIIPTLYHLFEVGETVICGLPDMDMSTDKWREDLLPVIEHSKYRDLMPKRGGGSRGGRGDAIKFRNGATLKFMSGGGGDKSRAGFTARVVVVTETDGMDQPGATSRESDKITQLEARTRAWGARKRIYLECTVSTHSGRTWQEYMHGTASQILLPCPHCADWVSPEREHLVGWQEAESQVAAREDGSFQCPTCSALWSEDERTKANLQGKLLHEGQTIDATGTVDAHLKPTDTLGFRWSGINNLFLTAGDLGADEWRASRAEDEENAEKAMKQFVWCIPVAPSKQEETALEANELTKRVNKWSRGFVPPGTQRITAAMDLGKYLTHWVAVAWGEGATGQVIDYGRIEVATRDLGLEKALLVALREFRDLMLTGWPMAEQPATPNTPAQVMKPQIVWVDAGYMIDVVYAFCRESGRNFQPSVGRGATQQRAQWYNRPTRTGSVVKHIGEGYHINFIDQQKLHLVEVDADHWKTWVHQRLTTPMAQNGAMTFYQAPPQDHLALGKHLTAERKTEEFVAGKGLVVRWEPIRRQNHWLDALYNACAAGHLAGVRLISVETKQPPPRAEPLPSVMGPLFDAERWNDMTSRYFGAGSGGY